MKNGLLILIVFLCYSGSISAQLTLQKVNSKKTVTIPLESNIRLIYPTKTSNATCDCSQSYLGILKKVDKNQISMLVNFDERQFVDENGVGKNVKTKYSYKNNKTENNLLSDNLLSVSKSRDGVLKIKNAGAVLAMLSIVHSLAIAPFYSGEIRQKSDKIALGAFAIGLSTAFLKTERKYHFQQPKNKKEKALWQLKYH